MVCAVLSLTVLTVAVKALGVLNAGATPPFPPREGEEVTALQIVSKYLEAVTEEQYDAAYALLAPAVRQGLPAVDFANEKRQQKFVYWQLRSVQIAGDHGIVAVRYLMPPLTKKWTAQELKDLPEQHGIIPLVRVGTEWYVAAPNFQ